MNFSLAIDFNQLKSLINQCGTEEKAEIIRMLEKDASPPRFNQKSWLGCMKGRGRIAGDIISPAEDTDKWRVLSE
jgi:hypothetical protein